MGTLVRDVLALKGDEYPIRVQVDDPEGVVLEGLEEKCYANTSSAEDFVKTHYGNVPGVTVYVYELREVYKVVENDEKDALEDLKSKMEALLKQVNEILKERR
jgi:hypothetical protein